MITKKTQDIRFQFKTEKMKFSVVDKWEMDILYKRLPIYLHFKEPQKGVFLVLSKKI